MFGHACTITTSFTPVISLQELELMSGTWCWRWSREKPLTLSIHTMDNSLGPIIDNFPVSLTASPRQHIYHPSPCSRVKMNTRLYWPRVCADQFSNLLFPRRPTQLRALRLCLLWTQSSRCHVLLRRIHSFLKGYEYYRKNLWASYWAGERLKRGLAVLQTVMLIHNLLLKSKQTKETSMMMLPSMSSSHKA